MPAGTCPQPESAGHSPARSTARFSTRWSPSRSSPPYETRHDRDMSSPIAPGSQPYDVADHYALLQQLRSSTEVDPLSANAPTATVNNPDRSLPPRAGRDGYLNAYDCTTRSSLDSWAVRTRTRASRGRSCLPAPGAGKSTSLGWVTSSRALTMTSLAACRAGTLW